MHLAYYQHPIDRMHQEFLQWQKKLRFIWPHLAGANNLVAFAHLVEDWAGTQLKQRGYQVEQTSYKHPYDLLVSRGGRSMRVEVKGSVVRYAPSMRTHRYQADIRSRDFELLLLACLMEIDQIFWFVLPRAAIGERRSVTITSRDPRDYGGQWSTYFEAWELVPEALATAPARPVQLRF